MRQLIGLILLLVCLVPGKAHAALADGFRIPFKVYGLGEFPVEPTCAARPEGDGYDCDVTVGSIPVSVTYGIHRSGTGSAKEFIYYVAVATATGSDNCDSFRQVLLSGWGPSRPLKPFLTGPKDPQLWRSGEVAATWEQNPYKNDCKLVVIHQGLYDLVKTAEAVEAQKAVKDI